MEAIGAQAGFLIKGESMKSIRDILREKGEAVWSISPEASVLKALELMAEKNIGALLVIDKGSLVGIISERDYARKVILKGKMSRTTRVRDIMTVSVLVVGPEQSVDECMALMTNKHVRHLPVLESGRLIGMISIGDVVKAVISDKNFTIEQLVNYITGAAR
jgi:CBS domain-containing protein